LNFLFIYYKINYKINYKILNMSLNIFWGNRQWYLFHLLSYNTSDDELCDITIKKIYIELFLILINLIPCVKCYQHTKDILKKFPIDWKNKDNMIIWFFNFHNLVNKSLEKKIYTIEELEINKKKPINHLYLFQLIKYYIDRALSGHSSQILVIKMLNRIIKVYPCLICKNQLIKYNSRYHINESNLKQWIHNILEYQKDLNSHLNLIKLKI
jgi:hypothetical protein